MSLSYFYSSLPIFHLTINLSYWQFSLLLSILTLFSSTGILPFPPSFLMIILLYRYSSALDVSLLYILPYRHLTLLLFNCRFISPYFYSSILSVLLTTILLCSFHRTYIHSYLYSSSSSVFLTILLLCSYSSAHF